MKTLNIHVEITDDCSTDGTLEMISEKFPTCHVNKGTGDLWWAGGTNISIKGCLDVGCDYVLLLNADTAIDETSLSQLLETSELNKPSIIASVAVCQDNPGVIWWAGSKWQPLVKGLPVWTSKYIHKRGKNINLLPTVPYETSEAHGRGVLIPRCIFEKIGLFDEKRLPHYGADTEFSLRVYEHGYKILVQPKSIVLLDTTNTGMKTESKSLIKAFQEYCNYLFARKNGEAIRVWWYITRKHLRFPDCLCTFFFILLLNSFRFWVRKYRKNK